MNIREKVALQDENARLKAEVAELKKRGEWQPIKTAPKDETEVLVRGGQYYTYSFYDQSGNLNKPLYANYCIQHCVYTINKYDKKDHEEGFVWRSLYAHNTYCRPTHWQPLATPPLD